MTTATTPTPFTSANEADTPTRGPDAPTDPAALVAGIAGVLFAGAIFGFFYAWVCSTMWAFDGGDPRVAMEAMQNVNAGVRNATFAPAFFGTPFVLAAAALLSRRQGSIQSARYFGIASAVYFFGGLILTMLVHVPLNEELAITAIPDSIDAAQVIWNDYSADWKFWNIVRTVFSGVSLAFAAMGVASLGARRS